MVMRRDLVIGIDCSTTATKAIAWAMDGATVASARRAHVVAQPHPGWHEQGADDWWDALAGALREISAQIDMRRVAGLSIAHQRETFVPVDADGRPLREAILWMDDRAAPLLPEIEAAIGGDRFHQLTGKRLSRNLTIAKILWLRRNEPQIFAAARWHLDTHAYLALRLTGQARTSWGSADPTGLYDMQAHAWQPDLLCEAGISADRLPELIPPGVVLGHVTAEAAAVCDLPAGLPVISGLGDGQAAGLGAGVTGYGPAYLSLGTSVILGAHSGTYLADRAFRTTNSGIPGAYLLETALMGGTYTISWFQERFGDRGALDVADLDAWDAAIADLPPGAAGLMLVPYWNSVLSPHWDALASGIVVGWRGVHDRRHLYRAILEGIAFEQRLCIEGIEAATGQPITGLIVMGGGSRSDLWRQMIADVTCKPVRRSRTSEATALGAGILSAAGAGLFHGAREAATSMTGLEAGAEMPDRARHEIYTRLYQEVYLELFPAVRPYLDRLAELTMERG
jgi:sugar (pentulose or hexulose) kinase